MGMEKIGLLAAALAGALVAWLSGYLLIPLLRRLKLGQTILEEGPAWHKSKQGTPMMGGLLFIIGSVAGVLVGYPFIAGAAKETDPAGLGLMLLGIFTALAFSAIGFIDDYLKVVRHQNLGLRARQKLVMQFFVAACFLATLALMGRLSTIVRLPFFGPVDFGLLFYPLSLVIIVGIVNAVNLTDGIDGLCGSVSFWVMAGYLALFIAFYQLNLSLWAAALAGGCLGYLKWNFYPAKVFMGDTGSFFLGGAVAAMGYCMGRPDLLIILSMVYLVEMFSVMIQVTYFKATHGKRIFKMTPIHHHFELSGWGEVKIDVVFSLVAIACAVIAYIYGHLLG